MVEILDEARSPLRPERLRRVSAALLEDLGLGDRSVTVVLVDAAAMRERNRRDRGVDAPTDVLSYPTFEPEGVAMPEVPHLGDVFVAFDVAAAQATEHGHSVEDETLVLIAHAITHLRGFDHTDDAAWTPFRAAERRVLELARALP